MTKQYTLIYGRTKHIFLVKRTENFNKFHQSLLDWCRDRRIGIDNAFNITVFECFFKRDKDALFDILKTAGKHHADVVNEEWELK